MAGDALISIDDALLAQVGGLGDALRARGWRMATAESCTGGLLAGACTAPAGASDWYAAGFVTYANDAKSGLLGVPAPLIAAHGAVSAEVANAMALGALAHAGVQLALSITGIAGPGGGSAAKPVGTVWLGLAWVHARETQEGLPAGGDAPLVGSRTELLQLDGDRAQIRSRTVAIALDPLLAAARTGA
ncbi:MAG: nicotinamide-nucleotide amidohydrolase family protein [Betaproteobacteria bacterium]